MCRLGVDRLFIISCVRGPIERMTLFLNVTVILTHIVRIERVCLRNGYIWRLTVSSSEMSNWQKSFDGLGATTVVLSRTPSDHNVESKLSFDNTGLQSATSSILFTWLPIATLWCHHTSTTVRKISKSYYLQWGNGFTTHKGRYHCINNISAL